jgi:hypothetical protein
MVKADDLAVEDSEAGAKLARKGGAQFCERFELIAVARDEAALITLDLYE